MDLAVEYIDTSGVTHNRTYKMSKLAFLKHIAIAGQGYAPKPQKLLRTIGMLFHYSSYMRRDQFAKGSFSEPPMALSDPTEKAQFSNLAGKAIADFLSKRIDKSLYTVNYEAAMRTQGLPIKGQRPDLIAYSTNGIFALEAKGRTESSSGSMRIHKSQAQSGPIKVNFSVACVSYNLFKRIKCNYHDPFNDNIRYDNESLRSLTRDYYRGLSEFLNLSVFDVRSINIQGEDFYEIALAADNVEIFFPFDFWGSRFFDPRVFDFLNPKLILPRQILQYADNGLTRETLPFIFENENTQNYIYIDNDRVGLRVSRL